MNDEITLKHTQLFLYIYISIIFLILWLTFRPSELQPAGPWELGIHPLRGRTVAKQRASWGSKSERKGAASTWTNDTPLIERGEIKGLLRDGVRCRKAPKRHRDVCLYPGIEGGKRDRDLQTHLGGSALRGASIVTRERCACAHVWLWPCGLWEAERWSVCRHASSDREGCNRGKGHAYCTYMYRNLSHIHTVACCYSFFCKMHLLWLNKCVIQMCFCCVWLKIHVEKVTQNT